jgi:Flp pilus assembly protein TadG
MTPRYHFQRGAVLVEAAITLPALLLMLLGVFEFSKALYAYHTVQVAAQMGARWASVRGSVCLDTTCPATIATVQTYVRSALPLLNGSNATVTTTWATTSLCGASPAKGPGCQVTVRVTYPFSFDLSFVSATALTLSSTSVAVISE